MSDCLRMWWSRLWSKTAPRARAADSGLAIVIPPPRDLPGTIIHEGDVAHLHHFHRVEWDVKRLGPPAVDFDEYVPGSFGGGFPMCTFKTLHRCGCGREIVTAMRALV